MLLFVVFVVFWSFYFHIILFDNEKTHHYAGFVWGVFFITIRNSDTVSVYDHPFLPPWEGWFAQTLITRLGHPQMGKKQMVPTFSGKNNSIFDGRKPYLTAWDLEKCNEWDNKSSIKCNNNKSNVLYQERKTPCGSIGLGTTSWGRSWGGLTVCSTGKKCHSGLNPAGWGSWYSPFLGTTEATAGAPT